MRRPEITAETFQAKQAGTLPGRYGFRVTAIDEGRLDAALVVEPWMLAPNGFLHAASVLLLADTAAGYACIAHLPGAAKNFTTIELKSNFLSSARVEERVVCRCTPAHIGRQTHVWDAEVTNESTGRVMALFRCTQMVLVRR